MMINGGIEIYLLKAVNVATIKQDNDKDNIHNSIRKEKKERIGRMNGIDPVVRSEAS